MERDRLRVTRAHGLLKLTQARRMLTGGRCDSIGINKGSVVE
jgi:hypothetical protein